MREGSQGASRRPGSAGDDTGESSAHDYFHHPPAYVADRLTDTLHTGTMGTATLFVRGCENGVYGSRWIVVGGAPIGTRTRPVANNNDKIGCMLADLRFCQRPGASAER